MNTLRVAALLTTIVVLFGLASCAGRREQAQVDSTPAGIDAAQVPDWPRDDVAFFLHGSMSAEFVPERVLRAFVKTYPDLFPQADLSNFGLIPDPAFGWPMKRDLIEYLKTL